MKLCLPVVLLVFLVCAASPAQEVLANESIVKMVKAGQSEDVIVNVVNLQPGKYSLSTDNLVALKNANVSPRVITAMMNKSQGAAPVPPAPAGFDSSTPPPSPAPATPASPSITDLKSIQKVYIEKMPNDLDQYLRAEFNKQLKGRVTVVLKKEEADGIITGINEEQKGTAAKVTGRYLGLHDTVNGTISLLDKTESNILWSDEAGDRNLFFGIAHRGGERKVADRLVSKLKKAMGY